MKHYAIKGVPVRLILTSWYVTPELRGCTANQPPRRGMKGALTQVLHHHAGRKAITRPFLCAVIFTSPAPTMLPLKSACTAALETLHGIRGGLWVQSETFTHAPQF